MPPNKNPIPPAFCGILKLIEKGTTLESTILAAATDYGKLFPTPANVAFVRVTETDSAQFTPEINGLEIVPVRSQVQEHHVWVGER